MSFTFLIQVSLNFSGTSTVVKMAVFVVVRHYFALLKLLTELFDKS